MSTLAGPTTQQTLWNESEVAREFGVSYQAFRKWRTLYPFPTGEPLLTLTMGKRCIHFWDAAGLQRLRESYGK